MILRAMWYLQNPCSDIQDNGELLLMFLVIEILPMSNTYSKLLTFFVTQFYYFSVISLF